MNATDIEVVARVALGRLHIMDSDDFVFSYPDGTTDWSSDSDVERKFIADIIEVAEIKLKELR